MRSKPILPPEFRYNLRSCLCLLKYLLGASPSEFLYGLWMSFAALFEQSIYVLGLIFCSLPVLWLGRTEPQFFHLRIKTPIVLTGIRNSIDIFRYLPQSFLMLLDYHFSNIIWEISRVSWLTTRGSQHAKLNLKPTVYKVMWSVLLGWAVAFHHET